jgi:hypothetical protein
MKKQWPLRLAGRIDCLILPYKIGRIRPAAIVVVAVAVAVAVVVRHCPYPLIHMAQYK